VRLLNNLKDEITFSKEDTIEYNLQYKSNGGKCKYNNRLVEERINARIARRDVDEGDDRWFSKEAIIRLQVAQEEVEWLLNRGYKIKGIIEFVGGRYQFSSRQREALKRATSSKDKYTKRKAKLLLNDDGKDGTVYIDGFNLIITLEVALSGGLLIMCNDDSIRDLAGLRGTYNVIDKTDKALDFIGEMLNELKVPQARFFLDAPVSNSGRLKVRILQHALEWKIPTEVELVPNVDSILSKMERVVTSDSVILDNCISWFNISRKIIAEYIMDAKMIDLSGRV
jgi:hypothetical protein